MNTQLWDALLGIVDSFGTLVVLLAVIWAVGAKKIVPGWVYQECRDGLAACEGKRAP